MDGPSTYDHPWVAAMLSKSVGDDAALAAVREHATRLGFGDVLDEHAVLTVLEAIATEPGLVGVTARFCRSRLIAQFSRENLERQRPAGRR
jgi:hypothetical protein